MSREEHPRLGFLGAFGFFVLWCFGTYFLVTLFGTPFFADIRFVQPNLPFGFFVENIERDQSTVGRWQERLRRTLNDFRMLVGTIEIDLSPNSPLFPPEQVEKTLKSFSDGPSGKGVAQTLERWLAEGHKKIPVPDLYGFPLLFTATPDTMRTFFPDLWIQGKAPTEVSSRGLSGLAGVFETQGWISFPLAWRGQKLSRQLAQKRTSLRIWLGLLLIGIVLSLGLAFISMPNVGEIGLLRLLGLIFGLYAFTTVGSFRTCYMRRIASDADEIDPATITAIKEDCGRYLEHLLAEEKITSKDKAILQALIDKR